MEDHYVTQKLVHVNYLNNISNMTNVELMTRILKRFRPGWISPNTIADIAHDLGIELTSDEINYISDNS